MDQVGFSVGPPQSGGECAQNNVNCSAVMDFTPFMVDSPQLIMNAFPGDPADATYSMMLTLGVNPAWTIRNVSSGVTKMVDPQTGNVM